MVIDTQRYGQKNWMVIAKNLNGYIDTQRYGQKIEWLLQNI